MIHTTLFKNEYYLVITTIVSIGVLSGCMYCSLLLATLLIAPVIKSLTIKLNNKRQHRETTVYFNRCDTCD